MKRIFITLALLAAIFCAAPAQTIIDLKKGGGVRAKTIDDYREEQGINERLKADSLAYIDHLTRAFNALHTDSLTQARRLFEDALRARPSAPGNYIVRYNLGRIDMAEQRYTAAVGRFSDVLRAKPDFRDARYDRALCYLEMNSLNAALQDCEALLADTKDKDERVRTLFLRSGVYRKAHQPGKSREDVKAILRLEPENESAQLLMACSYEDFGQPKEALNQLNLFLSAHPKNADALIARAQLQERLSMDAPAHADYSAAIALLPTDAALRVERAEVALRLGQKASAREDLKEAARLGYPPVALSELWKKAR